MTYNRQESSPFGGIISLVFLVLFFIALYYIAKAVFTILYWATPILFIITLILDYKVVVNYGKWLIGLTKRNPLLGIVGILLSIGLYPVVAFFLFGKAVFKKKVKEAQTRYEEAQGITKEGEYTEYEDVTEAEVKEPRLELPPLQKQEKPKDKGNEYDSLFE